MERNRLTTIVSRSESGPYMKESDFDMTLMKTVMKLVKDYQLEYDPKILVPADGDLADRVYQAAVDLVLEMGIYNQSTQRRILFSREEIDEAVALVVSAQTHAEVGPAQDPRILPSEGIVLLMAPVGLGPQGFGASAEIDHLSAEAVHPVEAPGPAQGGTTTQPMIFLHLDDQGHLARLGPLHLDIDIGHELELLEPEPGIVERIVVVGVTLLKTQFTPEHIVFGDVVSLKTDLLDDPWPLLLQKRVSRTHIRGQDHAEYGRQNQSKDPWQERIASFHGGERLHASASDRKHGIEECRPRHWSPKLTIASPGTGHRS